jgi:hypothetical protein
MATFGETKFKPPFLREGYRIFFVWREKLMGVGYNSDICSSVLVSDVASPRWASGIGRTSVEPKVVD